MGYGNCESKSNVKSRAVYMENTAENHMTSNQQQWRIPSKSPINSGKTFLDISVNTGQICLGFEADTPQKRQQHAHCMRLSDKDLVKKLFTSNRVNNFLTTSLTECRKDGHATFIFRGTCFKSHANMIIAKKV